MIQMPCMCKALSQFPGIWPPPSTANLSIANHVGQVLQGETKIKKKEDKSQGQNSEST